MRRRKFGRLLILAPVLALAIGGSAYLASNTVDPSNAGGTVVPCQYSSSPSPALVCNTGKEINP